MHLTKEGGITMDNYNEFQTNETEVPMNDSLSLNDYSEPTKNPNKKGFLKKLILIILLVLVLVAGCCFAWIMTHCSKKVYTSFLKGFSYQLEKGLSIMPDNDDKTIRFSAVNNVKREMDADAPDYMKNLGEESTEEFEILANMPVYFISTDTFKALWDEDNAKIYAVKMENGVEKGEVLTWDSSSSSGFYDLYSLKTALNNYLSDFKEMPFNNDSTEYKQALKVMIIISDTMAKNLKNGYFKDGKENGINEYTLSMNNKQIAEYVENVLNDLFKNKEFLELVGESLDEDSIEKAKEQIADIADQIEEMDGLSILTTIYARGDVKHFRGIKFEIRFEDNVMLLDLKYDGTETKGAFAVEDKSSKVNADLVINAKSIIASFENESRGYVSSSKEGLTFEMKTADDQTFNKTSRIDITVTAKDNNKEESVQLVIKGDADKPLAECSKVALSYEETKGKAVELFTVTALDKKALKESAKVEFAVLAEGEEVKSIIEAKDGRAIVESSELEIKMDEKTVLAHLKANDGKAIKETTDFIYTIPMLDTTLSIKTMDGKAFTQTSEIEMNYQGDYEGEMVDIFMHLKANKEFRKATKLSFETSGKIEDQEMKASGQIETLDNKPLYNGGKYKGSIECEMGEDMSLKGTFDSTKGFEFDVTAKEESYYSINTSHMKIVYELVAKKNLETLINTKDATSVKDVDKILEIIK